MADEKHIAEFMEVTNSDAETAKFYLESCGGDMSSAVETYLGHNEGHEAVTPSPADSAASARPPGVHGPRVAGFGDVASPDEADNDDEEPQDNEYYAGGENSGVAIKGGKKGDHVENLFESARQHGAMPGTEEDLTAPRSSRAFTGRSQTLVGGSSSYVPPPTEPPRPVTIAFYLDGVFTINDGPPRRMDDPSNREFLECVRRGECPPELENRARGRPATVNLVRKGTEYKPPEGPKYAVFTGRGQTLASTDPHPTPAAPGNLQPGNASLKIRFPDGTRAVARFNLHHTILDIRRFIAASRPDLPTGLCLRTGFPSEPLEDDAITVSQAGLLNTVVSYA